MKITIKINDMECPNCAMRLESIEDKLDGVESVEASYRQGKMVVEFDEKQISEAQILAEVKRLGYDAGEVTR